jgi:hypothetical protein
VSEESKRVTQALQDIQLEIQRRIQAHADKMGITYEEAASRAKLVIGGKTIDPVPYKDAIVSIGVKDEAKGDDKKDS